jgi:ATPase family associated with various cellular activities (AAA)
MKIDQAAASLRFALAKDRPAMLWGSPGIGKTAIVRAAAADASLPLFEMTLATLESVDLRGLPVLDGQGGVVWAKPDFLMALEAFGGPCVLFVDEANAVGPSLQVPMMQLVLERRVGPHKLPAGCRVVLAGNRQSDRASAQRMGTALANRLTHIDVEADLKAWLSWAGRVQLNPAIVAFLMLRGEGKPQRPGLLHMFDPDKPEVRAFPSPRSWEAAADYVDAPDAIRHGLIAGTVGEAAAAEFEGFLQVYRTMPPLPSIIANPDAAPVPAEPSLRYAVSMALSTAANAANFGNVLKYMARVGREFEICTATDAVRRKPDLASTAPYIHWAARNADVMI